MIGGHPAAKASVATGTIFQNPDLREFAVARPASAPRIQATYGVQQAEAMGWSLTPYMTPAVWAASERSKQYAGNQNVTVGGISLDIDADWVNGPVARW